jgi:hypothetical protein
MKIPRRAIEYVDPDQARSRVSEMLACAARAEMRRRQSGDVSAGLSSQPLDSVMTDGIETGYIPEADDLRV